MPTERMEEVSAQMRLAGLRRFFVVDRFDLPVTASPLKHRYRADIRARELNGPTTDAVRGVPERRPYRVIVLLPGEIND